MIMSVVLWFATTKLGRILGAIGAGAIALLALIAKIKSDTRADERRKQDAETMLQKQRRDEIDRTVGGMSVDDVRERLRKYER